MRIGNVTIRSEPALALAPMAGYTDVAYRELIARNGADIVYTELISATAIARQGIGFSKGGRITKTAQIIRVGEGGISAIQLFGANPADISAAVRIIGENVESGECGARLIDLNFGCPAKKVVKTGAGSRLLERPKNATKIVEAAAKYSPLPVTVKMRLGDKDGKNVEMARALEAAGVQALAVHGRTARQKFGGKADWEAIGEVVRAVSVPVFGNGDVCAPPDVKRICEVSGCAGVMAGRAVLADPLFFRHAREYLADGKWKETGWEEKVGFLGEYGRLSREYDIPFNAAKGLALQLACGFRDSARVREKITRSQDETQLMSAMGTKQDG